ncbi:9505_t:CDS:2 [Scutellospora calospora]|uniref:9505_t:CDS:1 n=1 Tax=Scutellospora calospora TaxID=85575 RepID=A0ACA9L4H8_9GLOM|nr:9505_t:CDS:2 [Scutellospora calospora]
MRHDKNPYLKFKNEIVEILKDNFEFDIHFDFKTIIHYYHKEIIVSKDSIKFLILYKYRPKANIHLNDIGRINRISKYYSVQPVVVTNQEYRKKAIKLAEELNVLLTHKSNIKYKLLFCIKKEIKKIELENIEKEEKIYLCIYE